MAQTPRYDPYNAYLQDTDRHLAQWYRLVEQYRERVLLPEASRSVRPSSQQSRNQNIRENEDAHYRALRSPLDLGRKIAPRAARGLLSGTLSSSYAEIPKRRRPRHGRDPRSPQRRR